MATLKEQLDVCQQVNQAQQAQILDLERKLIQADNSTLRWFLNDARIQHMMAVGIGVFFLSWLVTIAMTISEPTIWQYTLFRTVMSLGAAGVAATIPGDLDIKYKNLVRATGALAVFFLVYNVNPAKLAGLPEPSPTQLFQFKLLTNQQGKPTINCFSWPFSDVRKSASENKIFTHIEEMARKYIGVPFARENFVFLRRHDEKVIKLASDMLAFRNDGVVILDMSFLRTTEDTHLLFTRVNTTACK